MAYYEQFNSYVQYLPVLFIFSCYLYLYVYGGRRPPKYVRVNKSYMSFNIQCFVVSAFTFSTIKLIWYILCIYESYHLLQICISNAIFTYIYLNLGEKTKTSYYNLGEAHGQDGQHEGEIKLKQLGGAGQTGSFTLPEQALSQWRMSSCS